jgi:SHS2 domain-containing protein
MFAVMAPAAAGAPQRTVVFEFEEADLEFALVTWLNRLLSEARVRALIFSEVLLRRANAHWHAEASGAPWSAGMERGVEVKGATLTMLKVEQTVQGWLARCVIDV